MTSGLIFKFDGCILCFPICNCMRRLLAFFLSRDSLPFREKDHDGIPGFVNISDVEASFQAKLPVKNINQQRFEEV